MELPEPLAISSQSYDVAFSNRRHLSLKTEADKDLPSKCLRRNDDAMYTTAGIIALRIENGNQKAGEDSEL
jgi:hypothetical protein